jgi:DNA-directed RNA polymerase specialized sigma24 family protein
MTTEEITKRLRTIPSVQGRLMSHEEIGGILGIPPMTLRKIEARAIAKCNREYRKLALSLRDGDTK